MRFKTDWASLIVGRKFCFRFLTLYLRAIFQIQAPGGGGGGGLFGKYLEGRFNRGYFALQVWGAYTWSGLFSKFYGNLIIFIGDRDWGCHLHLNHSFTGGELKSLIKRNS